MKFSTQQFGITTSYITTLLNKQRLFIEKTKTRKTVFLTFVSTYGIKNIEDLAGNIHNELTMDTLFGR